MLYKGGVRAFTVEIPEIPAGTTLHFELGTFLNTNLAACGQLIRINQIQKEILTDFFDKISEKATTPSEVPSVDVVTAALAKKFCLYHPDKIMSDQGRTAVAFITPSDETSLELLDRVAAREAPVYNAILRTREECMAPVFTAEQSDGSAANFAIMPNGVATYDEAPPFTIDFEDWLKHPVPGGQHVIKLNPVPKLNYVCSSPSETRLIQNPQLHQRISSLTSIN